MTQYLQVRKESDNRTDHRDRALMSPLCILFGFSTGITHVDKMTQTGIRAFHQGSAGQVIVACISRLPLLHRPSATVVFVGSLVRSSFVLRLHAVLFMIATFQPGRMTGLRSPNSSAICIENELSLTPMPCPKRADQLSINERYPHDIGSQVRVLILKRGHFRRLVPSKSATQESRLPHRL